METRKLEVHRILGYDDFVGYLEDIVEGFRSGFLVIQDGDEYVTLTPSRHVEMVVEVRKRKGQARLSYALAWNSEADDKPNVRISSVTPDIAPDVAPEGQDAQNAPEAAAKTLPAPRSGTQPAERTPSELQPRVEAHPPAKTK